MLVLAGAPACGGPLSGARGPQASSSTTIDELRAELRAERRKRRDLENQIFLLEDRLETAQLRPRAGAGMPVLPVEVLAPDAADDGGAFVPEGGQLVGTTDDGTAIIYVAEANGDPITIGDDDLDGGSVTAPAPRPRPRAARAARAPTPRRAPLRELPTSAELGATAPADGREPPAVATGAPTGAPTAADDDEVGGDPALALYRRATSALRAREHAAAIALFRELVRRFPAHDYADNAQYWLGEAFYDQKDYARAITEFRATVTRYPRGNKVPDALLKIGFAYQALGQADQARAALEQVVSLYPGSSPAAIAAARLERLP